MLTSTALFHGEEPSPIEQTTGCVGQHLVQGDVVGLGKHRVEIAAALEPGFSDLALGYTRAVNDDAHAERRASDLRRPPADPAKSDNREGPAGQLPKIPAIAVVEIAGADRRVRLAHSFCDGEHMGNREFRDRLNVGIGCKHHGQTDLGSISDIDGSTPMP